MSDSVRNNHAAPAFNPMLRYQGYTGLVTDAGGEEVHRGPVSLLSRQGGRPVEIVIGAQAFHKQDSTKNAGNQHQHSRRENRAKPLHPLFHGLDIRRLSVGNNWEVNTIVQSVSAVQADWVAAPYNLCPRQMAYADMI